MRSIPNYKHKNKLTGRQKPVLVHKKLTDLRHKYAVCFLCKQKRKNEQAMRDDSMAKRKEITVPNNCKM